MTTIKHIVTTILFLWLMVSVMILCGEQTDGTIMKNIVVGAISLACLAVCWQELHRRNLTYNDNDTDDEDRW